MLPNSKICKEARERLSGKWAESILALIFCVIFHFLVYCALYNFYCIIAEAHFFFKANKNNFVIILIITSFIFFSINFVIGSLKYFIAVANEKNTGLFLFFSNFFDFFKYLKIITLATFFIFIWTCPFFIILKLILQHILIFRNVSELNSINFLIITPLVIIIASPMLFVFFNRLIAYSLAILISMQDPTLKSYQTISQSVKATHGKKNQMIKLFILTHIFPLILGITICFSLSFIALQIINNAFFLGLCRMFFGFATLSMLAALLYASPYFITSFTIFFNAAIKDFYEKTEKNKYEKI